MSHYQYVYIFQTCLEIQTTMHLKTVLSVAVEVEVTTATALFPLAVARCHKVALLFQPHRIPQVCLVLIYQCIITAQPLDSTGYCTISCFIRLMSHTNNFLSPRRTL